VLWTAINLLTSSRICEAVRACSSRNPSWTSTVEGTPGNRVASKEPFTILTSVKMDKLEDDQWRFRFRTDFSQFCGIRSLMSDNYGILVRPVTDKDLARHVKSDQYKFKVMGSQFCTASPSPPTRVG